MVPLGEDGEIIHADDVQGGVTTAAKQCLRIPRRAFNRSQISLPWIAFKQ